MKLEDHMEITKLIFGKDHAKVHAWLDATFPKWFESSQSTFNHWVERHHVEAIAEEYPGDVTRQTVAFFHVICDIASRWGVYFLPENANQLRGFLMGKGLVIIA